MTNSVNRQFRDLGLLQTLATLDLYPTPPYSGKTGGHRGYGYELSWWAGNESAIQSAVQRACYCNGHYLAGSEPYRNSGYEKGCRPRYGWAPEDVGDLPDGGWQAPGGAVFHGFDASHAEIVLVLLAIARSDTTLKVPTKIGPLPAQKVALELATSLIPAHAGMLRDQWGVLKWSANDRADHWTLRIAIQGAALLTGIDKLTYWTYIDRMLTGLSVTAGTRVYNGLYWLLPALWDLYLALPPSERELRARAHAECVRQSERCRTLALLLPETACDVDSVVSWVDLTPGAVITSKDTEAAWGIRAQHVAGVVLDAPECTLAALKQYDKKPGPSPWNVGAGGEPLWQ